MKKILFSKNWTELFAKVINRIENVELTILGNEICRQNHFHNTIIAYKS